MKDEHPVKFVVDQLTDHSIYTPLSEWVRGLIPGFPLPGESTVPPVAWQHILQTMLLDTIYTQIWRGNSYSK